MRSAEIGLENVNGGVRITTGGGRCIRRPKNK